MDPRGPIRKSASPSLLFKNSGSGPSSFPFLSSSSLSRSRLPRFLPSAVRPLPFILSLSHAPRARPAHGLHGRRRERPPPRREIRSSPVEFPGSAAVVVTHAPPRLLLPDRQLGHAPPAPLLQERARLVAPALGPGHPVPGQGEAPPPRRRRGRGRLAAAAAPARLRTAAVEPPYPPLRHRRAGASGGIGRRGRGGGARGARARAGGGGQEARVLRRAVQGGDRGGLRGDSRVAAPSPAQEAPAHGAAAARLAVPGIEPRRCDAGILQHRREVIGCFLEASDGRSFLILSSFSVLF